MHCEYAIRLDQQFRLTSEWFHVNRQSDTIWAHYVYLKFGRISELRCTIEACSFRDNLQSLKALWTEVVGVSVDTVKSHRKFAEKNRLNFPLVSDHDRRISDMYGVLSEDGSQPERTTFIIDREGKIARIFMKVDVTKHTDEVVAALKRLPLRKTK